ncbi:MAG: endolytic transglycosylase MltG [Leptolyngbyaceae cyanobacterium]
MKGFNNGSKRLLLLLTLLVGLGFTAWRAHAWWIWAISPPDLATGATDQKSVVFKIKQGTSAREIGEKLHSLGLIRSATAWNLWARWLATQDGAGSFQAGTYALPRTDSLPVIAAKIWSGDVARLSFTIPEGWNLKQMAHYFQSQGFFSARDFLQATQQFTATDYPWLPQANSGYPRLEGYLFPDTYQVAVEKVTPEAVIRQMLARFEQVALPVYQQSDQSMTLAAWVTLSSIVEKESVVPNERSRIAGVFHNRLKQGMSLGADPTVEYGLGIQQTPDRPLTFAEVNTPSPYNTYLNSGLPPTPIAGAGLASLKATLNPEQTDYLYFVARYDGTHVFSRTLTEHQTAQELIHAQRETAPKLSQPKTTSPQPTGNPG